MHIIKTKSWSTNQRMSDIKNFVASVGYLISPNGAQAIEKEKKKAYENRINLLFQMSLKGGEMISLQVNRILMSYDRIVPGGTAEKILLTIVALAARQQHFELLENFLSKNKSLPSTIHSQLKKTFGRLNGISKIKQKEVLVDQKKKLLTYLLRLPRDV